METWDPADPKPGARDPHAVPMRAIKEFLARAAVQDLKEEPNEDQDQEQLETVQTSKACQVSYIEVADAGTGHQEKCLSPALPSLGGDAPAATDCLDSSVKVKEEIPDVSLEVPRQPFRKRCDPEAERNQEVF